MKINDRVIEFSPDTVIKADSGVTEFIFEIPPEMAGWSWKIIYMNADGDTYEVSCPVVNNTIAWELSDSVTRESGRVAFTIEATTTDKVWHTKQCSFYVEQSIAHGGTVNDRTYEEVSDLVDSAGQYAVRAESAAETAEAVRINFSATAQPKSGGGGVVITVTDQNGTTTAELEDGEQGDSLTADTQQATIFGRTQTIVYIKNARTGNVINQFTVYDGKNGTNGDDGQDGSDGHSVNVSSSKSGSVTTLTFTDSVTGTTLATATINDGDDYVLTQQDIQGIEADLQAWCQTNILGGSS